jgi:molybdate transport system permease protein
MNDWPAVWLTLRLASITTLILFILGMPLAWWLARTKSRLKPVILALTALPIVLPPTVIGFYLLLVLARVDLAFTFRGLVIGSVIYSLPFVVQPLHNTFESIDTRVLEAASTLRATPLDRFRSVVLPLARPGIITAAGLGFAHTVGEFGVVLMIGGNIAGRTRVMSVAIYDHVEALQYGQANLLSVMIIVWALVLLTLLYTLNRRRNRRARRVRQIA